VKVNRSSGLKVVKKSEFWDSKLILLLGDIGYVVGIGNVWCFCTGVGSGRRVVRGWKCVVLLYWARRVVVVSVRRVARGWSVERPSKGQN
jgi:hypothetical protein